MARKCALVTGVTGQDGAYLAELLLSKGYDVHGLRRRSSTSGSTQRLRQLIEEFGDRGPRLHLHYGDLTDTASITRLVAAVEPTEIYNLAAQSHVHVSFDAPEYTANADAIGALRLLEAIRTLGMGKTTRFYQASTSEMFGNVQEIPQSETTPFYPRSPYGVAKLYAHWITVNYRESYDMHASSGILFNHESPLRGEDFVTRKITRAVATMERDPSHVLFLGNIDTKRDWGHARDYVEGMWRMLQQPQPDDYVLATGETHSVREFVELAFGCVERSIEWQDSGIDEKGIDSKTGAVVVRVDSHFFRPAEVDLLLGDPTKARQKMGWAPTTPFAALVSEMVATDLDDSNLRPNR